MKTIAIATIALCMLCVFSCQNNNTPKDVMTPEKKALDSLEKLVEDGHIAGMAKMGKLTRLQQQVKHMVDSIDKLPAKSRETIKPYKAQLDSLLKDLDYADFSMDKWMTEFNMDSAVNNVQERIQYLSSENEKVSKVKEAILSSLKKADSLLKF